MLGQVPASLLTNWATFLTKKISKENHVSFKELQKCQCCIHIKLRLWQQFTKPRGATGPIINHNHITKWFPSRWGTVCRLPNHVPSPPPSSGCHGRAHQQMCPLPVHHPDTQMSHHAILTSTFLKHGITRNRNFLWLPAHPYFSSRHNCHDQVQHSKNKRQLRSNPDDRSSRVVPWLPLPSRSLEIFAVQKAQASDFEQQLAGKTPSSCSKHLEELSAQIKSTCYVSSGWF